LFTRISFKRCDDVYEKTMNIAGIESGLKAASDSWLCVGRRRYVLT